MVGAAVTACEKETDQIGLSLPSPHASACGMGIVHTLLARGVSDMGRQELPANWAQAGFRGIGVDEPYVLI